MYYYVIVRWLVLTIGVEILSLNRPVKGRAITSNTLPIVSIDPSALPLFSAPTRLST
jgi:hypothetical protein